MTIIQKLGMVVAFVSLKSVVIGDLIMGSPVMMVT